MSNSESSYKQIETKTALGGPKSGLDIATEINSPFATEVKRSLNIVSARLYEQKKILERLNALLPTALIKSLKAKLESLKDKLLQQLALRQNIRVEERNTLEDKLAEIEYKLYTTYSEITEKQERLIQLGETLRALPIVHMQEFSESIEEHNQSLINHLLDVSQAPEARKLAVEFAEVVQAEQQRAAMRSMILPRLNIRKNLSEEQQDTQQQVQNEVLHSALLLEVVFIAQLQRARRECVLNEPEHQSRRLSFATRVQEHRENLSTEMNAITTEMRQVHNEVSIMLDTVSALQQQHSSLTMQLRPRMQTGLTAEDERAEMAAEQPKHSQINRFVIS